MALNIEELLALADQLDSVGKYKEAVELDKIIQKMAITMSMDQKNKKHERQVKEFLAQKRKEKSSEEMKDKPKPPVAPKINIKKDPEPKQDSTPNNGVEIEELMQEQEDIVGGMGETFMQGYDEKKKIEEKQNWADSENWNSGNDGIRIIEDMRAAGWQVFAPGELEHWLSSQKDYTKAPELPGVQIEDEEGLEDFEVPKETLASLKNATFGPSGKLPPWQPGAMDLGDLSRLGGGLEQMKEEVKQELDLFLKDPSQEAAEKLHAKISELSSDENIAKALEEAEREKGVAWAQRKVVFKKLAAIADRLDILGAVEEAGLIDGFMKKHAEDVDSDYQGEDDKSEQSKRYDSKHHHSLQIREPKTKQERIDREGRENHHVHTMQSVDATALSTRYCPEHVGVSVSRIGESTYQCALDGAVFNYETGWTDHDGNAHPGGSIAAQTPDSSGYDIPHRIFDSRENTLNRVT